jgi:transcriptional regulator with XRE-family HTH domain
MRVNSGMSVRALADRIGVSPSFIYQLEKGESAPSFSTLRKLADVFHSNVSVFVEDEMPEDWMIVRRDHRKQLFTGESGYHAELMLFLGSRAKRMQPMVVRIDPGSTMSDFVYQHQRDDFIYVCDGTVEVTAGGRAHRLAAGDCAYFTFSEPSAITNPGPNPAELVWVVSPASGEEARRTEPQQPKQLQ